MVVIRCADVDDALVIANHRVCMFREMGSLMPSAEEPLRVATLDYLEAAIPAGSYVGWIAIGESGAVVGGAGVQLRRMLPRPTDDGLTILGCLEAIVLNVYVAPEWRRRGIARSLMKVIIGWSSEAAVERLVLHASSEGRELYESMGFVPTTEMCLAARNEPRP